MSTGLKANNDGSAAIQVGGSDFLTVTSGGNTTFTQAANLPNTFGFKNRIINGAMVIDQRNAGASVTPNGSYLVDRWLFQNSQASKFTAQQNSGSVTPPAGFTNYLGFVSSSAYSVLTTDYFSIIQYVEGFNTADLAWGTASAATVTLGFWVRSSLIGTFGGSIYNSAANRAYIFSYTINSANTWEYKTVTIAGDTTGTWLTNNGIGIAIRFGLAAGSTQQGTAGSWGTSAVTTVTGQVNVAGTNGATFYITGVQLEKGSTATSFDYRPYGTELMLCQRYAWALRGNTQIVCNAFMRTTTVALGTIQFPVTMRATASLTVPNVAGYFNVSAGGSDFGSPTLTIAAGGTQINENNAGLTATFASGSSTIGFGAQIQTNNASSYVLFTAEL